MSAANVSYQQHLGRYLSESSYERLRTRSDVIDLAFGDPHEYPAAPLVELLQRELTPKRPDWFAYTRDHPLAQESIAARLTHELRMPFEPDDIALTNGAFAGIAACLRGVCDPGDEVVYCAPSWFYYEPMIRSVGATPRRVDLEPGSWHLDVSRIEAALTPATSAVIVNSPNNPTGVVYSDEEFTELARVLTDASQRYGHPVYLISDEVYRRIVFDEQPCPSPGTHYPYTFLVHSYTKTLLLPGERIGYVALPPTMPDRAGMRECLTIARLMTGWAFPNNSLLFAAPELDDHAIPIVPLRRRRDLLVDAFSSAGFRVSPNQGTFYLLAAVPDHDDWTHADRLEKHGLLALPGSVMGAPGHLRLSLTISDEMTEVAVARVKTAYLGSDD